MQHKLPIGISVLGILVVALGAILGWAVIPKVIDNKISDQTKLEEDGETFEKWQDIPYPIYLSFYIFHVDNPDDVEAGGKPILVEKGPYAYRQTRLKVNITHKDPYDPTHTIQYQEKKTYFFDKEKSNGNTEDDLVNVINIAYVAVVHGVRSKAPTLTTLVANIFLASEKLVRRNVKVGELLFKGFDVSLYSNNPVLALALPEEFSGGRFGLYKGENGTNSKIYNIYTGVDTHEHFGLIKEFAGKADLGFWVNNTECDKVKGSDGSLYPPFFTKERKFDVFSSDLCRSLQFEYKEDIEFEKVQAYRFVVPKKVLEDPRINKDNQCYCNTLPNLEACPKAGAISLEKCRGGAPIMMSTPYFLDGDKGYLEATGLADPDLEKHLTYLDIEPHSGVLLRGHKRIQVNVDLKVGKGINAYKHLKKDIVFPLVWADEHAEMDEENVNDLKSKLLTPLKIVDIAKYTILGVGVAIFAVAVALYIIKRRRSKETI